MVVLKHRNYILSIRPYSIRAILFSEQKKSFTLKIIEFSFFVENLFVAYNVRHNVTAPEPYSNRVLQHIAASRHRPDFVMLMIKGDSSIAAQNVNSFIDFIRVRNLLEYKCH